MKQAMNRDAFARVQENLRKGREKHAAMQNRAVCATCGAAVLRHDETHGLTREERADKTNT